MTTEALRAKRGRRKRMDEWGQSPLWVNFSIDTRLISGMGGREILPQRPQRMGNIRSPVMTFWTNNMGRMQVFKEEKGDFPKI